VLTIWHETPRVPCRAGELQHTGVPHESFVTRHKATFVLHTSEGVGGGLNSLEGGYLYTVSYTKARLNEKFIGLLNWIKRKEYCVYFVLS